MSSPNPSSIPTTQRAIQFTAPQPLKTITYSTSAPVPSFPSTSSSSSSSSQPATLVRVLSAGLNPVDYKLASLPLGLPRLAIGPSPMIPATDFVGRVAHTTDPSLALGDLVFGKLDAPSVSGTCAEYTLVRGTHGIAKVPSVDAWTASGRSTAEFAGVGVAGLTALMALRRADLPWSRAHASQSPAAKAQAVQGSESESGGKVFINGGSGGVGTFAIQLAKHVLGCTAVVASCSGANAALVTELGADTVIDYKVHSKDKGGVAGALKDWASKNGEFDAVIDLVGADMDIYWQAHHYLKPSAAGGRYIQIGAGMDLGAVMGLAKVAMWPGILGGGKRAWAFASLSAVTREDLEFIAELMVNGKVRCIIDDENVFELEEGKKAYDKLHTGRVRGKVVVTCGK